MLGHRDWLGAGKIDQSTEAVLCILCGQGFHLDPRSVQSVLANMAEFAIACGSGGKPEVVTSW